MAGALHQPAGTNGRTSGYGSQHCSCQCHWDMGWLHFGDTRIAAGDVDGLFVVERYLRFLYVETKGPQEFTNSGQQILLEQLSRVPGFTVCVLRGPKGFPQSVQFVKQGQWQPRHPTDRRVFQSYVDEWFTAANQNRSPLWTPWDGECAEES